MEDIIQDQTLKQSFMRNSQGSLFDKVLNKVQMKNKIKKSTKNLIKEIINKGKNVVQNLNKIFIIAEKPNKKNNINNQIDQSNDFSILNDYSNVETENSKSIAVDINKPNQAKKDEIRFYPLIDKLMNDKPRIYNINDQVAVSNSINLENCDESISRRTYTKNNLDCYYMNPKFFNDLVSYEKELFLSSYQLNSKISQLSSVDKINMIENSRISPSFILIDTIDKTKLFIKEELAKKNVFEINQIQINIPALISTESEKKNIKTNHLKDEEDKITENLQKKFQLYDKFLLKYCKEMMESRKSLSNNHSMNDSKSSKSFIN